MKNQGISLISLIITIIVIIILAAIVIFTGLGTPDSANFAKFCSSVDDVQMAVLGEYSDIRVQHAISGDTRNDEALYKEIATGTYPGTQGAKMDTSGEGVACQNITKNFAGTGYYVGDLKLPLVKEVNTGWYVTATGKVFNATGYYYDGNTYYNASTYTSGDTAAQPAHIASLVG